MIKLGVRIHLCKWETGCVRKCGWLSAATFTSQTTVVFCDAVFKAVQLQQLYITTSAIDEVRPSICVGSLVRARGSERETVSSLIWHSKAYMLMHKSNYQLQCIVYDAVNTISEAVVHRQDVDEVPPLGRLQSRSALNIQCEVLCWGYLEGPILA